MWFARLLYTLRTHSTVATFTAGFLFDVVTLQRIDARTDLAIQLAYLTAVTWLLVLQGRQGAGLWTPGPRLGRLWHYNQEALHFLYGGLLSAYVVLYFRSSTLAAPAIFLVLLVAVMVINEVPRVRRAGHPLRLGLYGFCVLSFLTYFIPILVGRMDGWIFLLSLLTAATLIWHVTRWIAPPDATRDLARRRLFAPAGAMLVVVALLYVLRLILPVPLSVQFQGIYHQVLREGEGYTLVYQQSPVWAWWRRDSRPFAGRDGDRLHYFARVFAPSGFRHRVMIRWERYGEDRGWETTDRIPLNIVGGREQGFRGYAVKANFAPGRWRVTAETEDGRAIATISFDVEQDDGTGERRWGTVRG